MQVSLVTPLNVTVVKPWPAGQAIVVGVVVVVEVSAAGVSVAGVFEHSHPGPGDTSWWATIGGATPAAATAAAEPSAYHVPSNGAGMPAVGA
jgi:hypothetical protein